MTELVVCLSSGKGSVEYIDKLIKQESWEKVFLITDLSNKNKIEKTENLEIVEVDFSKPSPYLRDDIVSQLRRKIRGMEVAVNIVSGTGKEHMAIISALLRIGVAIRFVILAKSGVKEI